MSCSTFWHNAPLPHRERLLPSKQHSSTQRGWDAQALRQARTGWLPNCAVPREMRVNNKLQQTLGLFYYESCKQKAEICTSNQAKRIWHYSMTNGRSSASLCTIYTAWQSHELERVVPDKVQNEIWHQPTREGRQFQQCTQLSYPTSNNALVYLYQFKSSFHCSTKTRTPQHTMVHPLS